ncbi:hypothetical protein EYZ11_011346 [Aspergillus tanneri]|uniref:Xylanolytic transcriptional activator regulatory domain-containing protein n=1 Tax=Aspergillus tanneri TaxID=1220188 RepID=A0A4S3J8D0_9EURO|nr:hypothetical protein EYZ11_011346 [Aspergillus tanneri]
MAELYSKPPVLRRNGALQSFSTSASLVQATGRLTSQHSSNASSPGSAIDSTRLRATMELPSTIPGYLGSTSYSAVLAEHPSELSFEVESSVTSGSSTRLLDPARLQSGLEMLKLLHRLTICDSLIRKYYSRTLCVVIPSVVIEAILQSIRSTLNSLDFSGDIDSQFQDLALQIFQNSSRPMAVHGTMTVEDYCASFTGKNLRWEAVIVVFVTSGIASMSTPDNDPDLVQVAGDSQAKDRLRVQIVEASDTCLGFCDQAASVNELLGFCQYNDVMLRTQQYGDSSFQGWRRLGDLSATVYALGAHQESEQADDCPFFLRQWRRIFFVAAFYVDKCVATFVGRPPFINYRYCTLTPPLDLREETLIAGGEKLNRAISELDMAGWGEQDKVYRVSVIRLRFLLAVFREQALEIALGTCDHWDLEQRSSHIIEKARVTWEAAPAYLRFDVRTKESVEPFSTSFTILHMYLDYQYTIFLLQRTLVKRTNTGQEALLETSRRVLSILITVTAERDSVLDLSIHYSWLILYYGLPSASVLMLELLHQAQDAGLRSIILPRAELIRNLSVFVSCLSWVSRPSHGNYQTCKEAEKKLSHILDQILDPQPIQQEILNDVTSGLSNFLDFYNPSNWDFNSEYLPPADGFVF